jgi:ribonucleoside-diphosphate reductase alpha chain
MVGLKYGSEDAVYVTEQWMKAIARASYLASVELAKEKGSFPLFDAEAYLASGNMLQMGEDVRAAVRAHGIRNSLLTSIAPTGTISLYAGNVSSGIEPVFAYAYTRKVLQKDGSRTEEEVVDYAVRLWRELKGDEPLPDYFTNAQTLTPLEHVRMQAAAQKWVDSSISKTINCPEDISFEDFQNVYMAAWDQGCKGCTTYRPNDVTGSVLSVSEPVKSDALPPVQAVQDVKFDKLAERDEALDGTTYKLKWPGSRDAVYVTINNTADGAPFELFLTTKGVEHSAWMTAVARTVSAVFRRGGDVQFIADELREIHDPKGGAFVKGEYRPSMIAAIGDIVKRHLVGTGQIAASQNWNASAADVQDETFLTLASAEQCPSCGEYGTMKHDSGCASCTSCGHSKCG